MASSIVNAATLIVGDTGTGKTSLLKTAAEYCWEEFHKVFRLYSKDLGGFPTAVESLMKIGIIEVWRMGNHVEPFETCERASQGWWPTQIDTRTGIAAPNSPLLGPIMIRYSLMCPAGHVVRRGSTQAALVPTLCKPCSQPQKPFLVSLQNGSVERTVEAPSEFEHIGGVGFDGLTSWQMWIMEDMAERRARGDLSGEETAIGGKIVSGDLIFGANNRSHYGFAQNRVPSWIANSIAIPNLMMAPVWTALELRATDDLRGVLIFGPKIAGKARTDEVPAMVGNCLRTCIRIGEKDQTEWRLYLREHMFPEEGNIPHLAKTRTDPDALPEYLVDPPEASTDPKLRFSRFSLKHFFRLVDQATVRADESARTQYPDAPGLAPSGPVPEAVPVQVPTPASFTGPATPPPQPTATVPEAPRAVVAQPVVLPSPGPPVGASPAPTPQATTTVKATPRAVPPPGARPHAVGRPPMRAPVVPPESTS